MFSPRLCAVPAASPSRGRITTKNLAASYTAGGKLVLRIATAAVPPRPSFPKGTSLRASVLEILVVLRRLDMAGDVERMSQLEGMLRAMRLFARSTAATVPGIMWLGEASSNVPGQEVGK
ncbi:hypothetical protein INS49_008248 [Diaporthe citri]|uniref:uncharacterized protein n=1 Tax=Diaporthe citri TaxID=83186 RepID=UPI001C80C221|nr:uncharacterized protein INS49_008248 [Diaporthe citri]KAG6363153.1 hypothetical protein INS49_008248 [Diaporthe citri]